MRTSRRGNRVERPFRGQKSPSGRPLCCLCGDEIPAGSRRREWCGQACVDRYLEARGDGIRERVFNRDRGICSSCGLDCVAAWDRFKAELARIHALIREAERAGLDAFEAACREAGIRSWHRNASRFDHLRAKPPAVRDLEGERAMVRAQFRNQWRHGDRVSLWEADHVLALIEGGTHGLENLRTLCLPCHRRETAALAGRRARARKGENLLPGIE